MKILLTNDDGIDALGLQSVIHTLKGKNELYVAAPTQQRSGFSHSATYFMKDCMAYPKEIDGVKGAWAIDGTPADCAFVGSQILMDEKPDLIISGINHGENTATDCIYSGTIGAASEGLIFGIPAIAISLCSDTSKDFALSCKILEKMIPLYMEDKNKYQYVLNINLPDLKEEEVKGILVTSLDFSKEYQNILRKEVLEDGSIRCICENYGMEMNLPLGELPQTDAQAIQAGYISISPINHDICATKYLSDLKRYQHVLER